MNIRRLVTGGLLLAGAAVLIWIYFQSLVPAIHQDHDHGLDNIAGGGQLRVQALGGGHRNLVGRPDRVLILHWFNLGTAATTAELPALIDYARSVENDAGIEVVLVAIGRSREQVLEWANGHGVPIKGLYADPEGKTARLIGVRNTPETLIYGPTGQLVHQARGSLDWSDPQVRTAIASNKSGGDGEAHQH